MDAAVEVPPMTKSKDPQDLKKTGKAWSHDDDRNVNRIFALVAPKDGLTFNAAIEKVLGRKPGDPTLAGSAEWRKLYRRVATVRSIAKRTGIDIPYDELVPEEFNLPPALREQMAAFAEKLAARYLKSGSDMTTGSSPKT